MADTYRKLAQELEKIVEANEFLDEQRDGHLLSMIGGGGVREAVSSE